MTVFCAFTIYDADRIIHTARGSLSALLLLRTPNRMRWLFRMQCAGPVLLLREFRRLSVQ
jgi:hypothetical protein